jgi:hypothetical protein
VDVEAGKNGKGSSVYQQSSQRSELFFDLTSEIMDPFFTICYLIKKDFVIMLI